RRAVDLPGRGVEDARIPGIHAQVDRSGAVVDEQNALPALSAVARAEHPALVVGSEGVSEGRDVDDLRVARIDAHAPDLARVLEPDVLPRAARVHRLVDPVAVRDVAADARLAHPDLEHVRLGPADPHASP